MLTAFPMLRLLFISMENPHDELEGCHLVLVQRDLHRRLQMLIVNQLMPKKKAELEAASAEYDRVKKVYEDEGQRLMEKQNQLQELHRWADIFDQATRQAQHMIIAGLVERVDVGTGYNIQVKLRISAMQFFSPDNLPEAVVQAS